MAKKKDKKRKQAQQARQNIQPKPDRSLMQDNEALKKVFSSLFYFAGAMVIVYELINYFRSDTKTFTSLILPGLIGIVWLVVLVQMFRKGNPHAYVLLAITVVGGVVGGISWQSYNQIQETRHAIATERASQIQQAQTTQNVLATQQTVRALEEKLIVVIAAFEGPEDVYGLRNEIKESLDRDFAVGNEGGVKIETIDEIITPDSNSGSKRAVELGKSLQADIVIWGWYRQTENPNITIHVENLSPNDFSLINESETYQPEATIADLESFEIQKQIGTEAANLVNFLAGYLYFQVDDFEKALELFERVSGSGENITVIHKKYLFLYSGFCNYNLGRPTEAIARYSLAIQLDSGLALAYDGRGAAYDWLGEFESAIQDYDQAIQIDSRSAITYYNRGHTYLSLKQYERAIEDFDQSINRNSEYANAYSMRGISYRGLDQNERAIEDFDRAIQLEPTSAFPYVHRGHSYVELGQNERAIQDFDKAIQLEPNAWTYWQRGSVYHFFSQYERAIQDYDQAIQIDPGYFLVYVSQGRSYLELGQYERAVQSFDKAIQLFPHYVEAYFYRGYTYNKLGQHEQAIQDLNQAIQLDPDYAEAYRGRGTIYQQLGYTSEAEADFKKYEELTGQKP